MKHNNNIDREEQHDGILWPQVKYEDISEEDRHRLEEEPLPYVNKDEFEAWLAIQMTYKKSEYEDYFSEECDLVGEERDSVVNHDLEAHMRYLRAKYKLVRMILDYDYGYDEEDWSYFELYKLERQKMICMEEYISHSRIADTKGNYQGKRWLCLCIKLLDYILYRKKITPEQLSQLNIKNSLDLIPESERRYLLKLLTENKCASYFLEGLYQRKVERLYYRIRLEYMHLWFVD